MYSLSIFKKRVTYFTLRSALIKNKPPLKRGKRGSAFYIKKTQKGYSHCTPFMWWFVKRRFHQLLTNHHLIGGTATIHTPFAFLSLQKKTSHCTVPLLSGGLFVVFLVKRVSPDTSVLAFLCILLAG